MISREDLSDYFAVGKTSAAGQHRDTDEYPLGDLRPGGSPAGQAQYRTEGPAHLPRLTP